MSNNKGFLHDFFIPKQSSNSFTFERYISELEASANGNGPFRDQWNLGVLGADGGKWLLKDFTQEPNALFVGAMGSGKSMAAAFSATTWFAANSDQSLFFVVDPMKGANDYSALFKYPNVYPVRDEGGMDPSKAIPILIDIVYSEVMARKDLFNSVNATNIKNYEKITGKSMARVVMVYEEFHAIPYQILEFDSNFKKEHTPAAKFLKILRVGRTYGVWVLAASQKSTKSDIPSELIPGFTQKQLFKVSQGEAAYVLGDTRPSMLNSSQKGRCFTDFGEVQFPFLPVSTQEKILAKLVKPLSAECAYLTDQIIKDSLAGKTNKEVYKHRPLSELTEGIEAFDGELVIEILHEKLGHTWTAIDSQTDSFGICGVAEFESEEKRAVMFRNSNKGKISVKSMSNLVKACIENKTDGGILYTIGENLSSSIYKFASENGLLIVDYEDLATIGRQVDGGKIDAAKNVIEKFVEMTDEDGDFDNPRNEDNFNNREFLPKKQKPVETKSLNSDVGNKDQATEVKNTLKESKSENKKMSDGDLFDSLLKTETAEEAPIESGVEIEIDENGKTVFKTKNINTLIENQRRNLEKASKETEKYINEISATTLNDIDGGPAPVFEKRGRRKRRTAPMPDFQNTEINYASMGIDARAKGKSLPYGPDRARYLYKYKRGDITMQKPEGYDDPSFGVGIDSSEVLHTLFGTQSRLGIRSIKFKKDLIKDKIFTKLNQEPKMIDLPQSEEDWNKLLQLSRHQIDEQKEKIKESEAFRKKKESLPKEMFEIVPFEKSASLKIGTEK